MKYVCIDIETTGLDPETNQIIEIAAVIRDLNDHKDLADSPSFHYYVKHDSYVFDGHAAIMNVEIVKQMSSATNVIKPESICNKLYEFLEPHFPLKKGKLSFIAAGKNFGNFDLKFLENLSTWKGNFNVDHKILDPAILWLKPTDDRLPSLNECLKRSGATSMVQHTALKDVYDTIYVLETMENESYKDRILDPSQGC
jgi:oligoribonuclease (3'-5' exoribonuclease)